MRGQLACAADLGDPQAVAAPYEDYKLSRGPHGYPFGHMAIDLTGGKGATILSPINGMVTGLYVDALGAQCLRSSTNSMSSPYRTLTVSIILIILISIMPDNPLRKSPFVGRERELILLQRLWESQRPELMILYGRRRVGKPQRLDNPHKFDSTA